MTRINRPGAPAKPPQHILTQDELPPGGDTDRTGSKHRQTGEDTAAPGSDVADPHPSDEEHPYRARNPGRATPAVGPHGHGREGQSAEDIGPVEAGDIGPNSSAHDGTPKPPPRNAETE